MARLWCAKCTLCSAWYYVSDMSLVWQESEGVYRGVCGICYEDIEKKARELDWE